jgi:uroporphyrinogen decarboxylase
LRRLACIASADVSPVVVIWCDVGIKNSLLYPPALLEEFLFPHLKEMVDLLHSRSIRVVFHSDGEVAPILRRLEECGIDGFNPLEISAGLTPERFREICGRRMALVGGMDAVEVLAYGTPAQVRQKTRALIDLFRRDGTLLMGSSSGQVDESMPTENVAAMYETTWEYGKY